MNRAGMITIKDMPSEDVLCGVECVWKGGVKGRGYTQGSFREERSNAGGGKVDRPCKEHCFESLYHYQDCPSKTKATEHVEVIDLFTEYSSKLTMEFMGEAMSDYVVSSNNSLEMIGQEEFYLSNDKEVINNDMDADDIDAEGEEAYHHDNDSNKQEGKKEEVEENGKLYDEYLIETQDQERVDEVNDDKEVGYKVVEVEDTEVEDLTEGALESFELIDNNLEEMDEEFNQSINMSNHEKEFNSLDEEAGSSKYGKTPKGIEIENATNDDINHLLVLMI